MSEIIRLPHSQWETFFFDVFGEFWARRVDRQISEEEKGQGLYQVILAYSAERRQQKIDEQDALERELAGGAG